MNGIYSLDCRIPDAEAHTADTAVADDMVKEDMAEAVVEMEGAVADLAETEEVVADLVETEVAAVDSEETAAELLVAFDMVAAPVHTAAPAVVRTGQVVLVQVAV